MSMDTTISQPIDEEARRRFEEAWREGRPQPLERFLAEDSPYYAATLEELVHIDLEFAWRGWSQSGADTLPASQPPLVEGYLARFPRLNQPEIVRRLLEQERLVRLRHGDRPSPSDYCARFPTLIASRAEVDAWRRPAASVPRELPDITGYEVLGVLGRGGMGVVYRARQIRPSRIVALKMILAGDLAGPEELARFRSEAEAIARLQHPNIVQIHEVGEHEGRPFFSLEYIDGGSLAQRLAATPQPARQAAALVETLARAMDSVHQRGIVHRDLKPANVLLQIADSRLQIENTQSAILNLQSVIPKITDFGLAKSFLGEPGASPPGDLTQSGAILGTPSYMAPEQAAGKIRQVGVPADVYALGAILYEMLTGRPPFRAETFGETVLQVLSDEPVSPVRFQPKLPRDLETICLKCLAKEPRQRYPSAASLADDLHRYLKGEPIRARPVGALERGWKWAKRRPAAAGLLVVGLAVLLGLAAGGFWYSAWLEAEVDREQRNAREADRLRANAQTQRERAEANFRAARAAVDQMLTRVGAGVLANVPQMEHVRRKVLEDALRFYLDFLEQKSDDPEVRRETARAFRRVGDIRVKLGRHADALKDYGRALALQEKLRAEFPGQQDHQLDLAVTHMNRGYLLAEIDKPRDAEADFRKALPLLQKLAPDHAAPAVYRQELATCYQSLGNLLSDLGRRPEAEDCYRKAVSVQEKLAAEIPKDPKYRSELARTYNNLGLLLRTAKRRDEAKHALDRSIDLQSRLVKDYPDVPDFRFDLAGTYNSLALLLSDTYRDKEALAMYGKGADLLTKLVRDFHAVPDFRSQLGGTLQNLADLLLEAGQADEARKHLNRAIIHQRAALAANPRHPQYRLFLRNHCVALTDALLRLKRHAEAAEATPLMLSVAGGWQDYRDAAAVLAQCAALAEKDDKLPSHRRAKLARTYGIRAVGLLREAAQKGFRETDLSNADERFRAIRSLDEFQKLMRELKTKKKGGTSGRD